MSDSKQTQPVILVTGILTAIAIAFLFRMTLWPFSLFSIGSLQFTTLVQGFVGMVLICLEAWSPIANPRFRNLPYMVIFLTTLSLTIVAHGVTRDPIMTFQWMDFVTQVILSTMVMLVWIQLVVGVLINGLKKQLPIAWGVVCLWGSLVCFYLYWGWFDYLRRMFSFFDQ